MPLNQYGFEVDENGDLVRTPTGDRQRTPGADAINLHTGHESRDTGMGRGVKNLDWSQSDIEAGGAKQYRRPQDSLADYNQYNDGGGLTHTRGNLWNPTTGQYEAGGHDWGKILSMVVAGALTAGAASALMGGGAAAEAAISSTVATGQVPADIAGAAAASAGAETGAGVSSGLLGASAETAADVAGTGAAASSGGLTAGGAVKGAMAAYKGYNQLARLVGSGAASEAGARRSDAQQQAGMDTSNNAAQLNAAKFNLGAPDTLLHRLARVGVGMNAKDVGPTGDARIDKFGGGGLRPSLLQNPETQQGFKEAQRQALMSLMNKDYQVKPAVSTLPKPGLMENVGGGIATASGLAQTGKGIYDSTKDLWQPDTATSMASGWEDYA